MVYTSYFLMTFPSLYLHYQPTFEFATNTMIVVSNSLSMKPRGHTTRTAFLQVPLFRSGRHGCRRMKKTSTRLASIGGCIVLGACAIALAQHDSRNRPRETSAMTPKEPVDQEPIAVESSWGPQVDLASARRSRSLDIPPPIVRANNEQPSIYTALSVPSESESSDSNPLRGSISDVPPLPGTSASNDVAAPALSLPTTAPERPAWLPEAPAPDAAASAPASLPALPNLDQADTSGPPSLRSTGMSSTSTPPAATVTSGIPAPVVSLPLAPTALPTDREAPAELTSIGSNSESPHSAAISDSPSAPSSSAPIPVSSSGNATALGATTPPVTDGYAQPPATPSMPPHLPAESPVTSQVSDMSDTQRGVMSATVLTAPVGQTNLGPAALPPSVSAQRSSSSAPQRPAALPMRSLPSNVAPVSVPRNAEPLPAAPTSSAATPSGPAPGSYATETVGRLASLSSNRPGSRSLDGAQSPVIMINKVAPEEVQVGKRATITIEVENRGQSTAHGVRVLDRIPRGVKFVKAIPAAQEGPEGMLTWDVGKISAGEKRTISLTIIPEIQGEIGSVATVQIAAQASMRSIATLPKLELDLQASQDVLLGGNQKIVINLRNTGTGTARNVNLEADIPTQLRHESGDTQLEAPVGELRPGESRSIELFCSASQPGAANCEFRAIAADGIRADKVLPVKVLAPELVAAITGPKVRYLERQATYKVAVKNTGTAAATNLEFELHLPAGLKFNNTDANGHYNPATHSVSWGLQDLQIGQTAPIEVAVLPVDLGTQVISFGATADLGIQVESKSEVAVRGLSELAFTVGQDDGTIEIGSVATYSVQVTNVGNESDRNVQLAVDLPKGAKLLSVLDSPVKYQSKGSTLTFAPIPEMRNRDQYTFRFQVQHDQQGRQIVRSKLTSQNWPQPVVKETGTLIYDDEE